MIELETKDSEIRTRLATNVAELAHTDTAEAIDEEILNRGVYNAPAAFTLLERVEAKPKSIGSKSQVQTLRLTIGIVTQSLRPGASSTMRGAKGSYKIREKVAQTIHWWHQAGMLRPWRFVGEESVGRAGGKLLYQQIYENNIDEAFS